GGRFVERPRAAALDGLVARARDGWGSGVNHGHFLAALDVVAAGIRGPPGPRGDERVAAVTGGVGRRADECDGDAAAGVGGGWLVEGPGAGTLDGLVACAGDGWGGRVEHGHLLAALDVVAAGIGGPPGPRGDEGVAAVIGGVGRRADDCDGG